MEKVSLPIKTKIAAWWMIAIGIIIFFEGIVEMIKIGVFSTLDIIFWGLPVLFLIFSALFLLKRKKWAWYIAIGTTSFISLFIFEWYLPSKFIVLFPFFTFAPLTLLLLDRKNFWEITIKPTKIPVSIGKLPFPIKTRIAGCLMIIFGSIGIILLFLFTSVIERSYFTSSGFVIWLFWLIWILIGVSILGREKWAWWIATVFSAIGSIILVIPWFLFLNIVLTDPECFLTNCFVDPFGHIRYILFGLFEYSMPLIIPLILLLLDRKNFFKVVK